MEVIRAELRAYLDRIVEPDVRRLLFRLHAQRFDAIAEAVAESFRDLQAFASRNDEMLAALAPANLSIVGVHDLSELDEIWNDCHERLGYRSESYPRDRLLDVLGDVDSELADTLDCADLIRAVEESLELWSEDFPMAWVWDADDVPSPASHGREQSANSANSSLFPRGVPDNAQLVQFAVRIQSNTGQNRKSKNALAREICNGDRDAADSLCTQLRTMIRDGRCNLPKAQSANS